MENEKQEKQIQINIKEEVAFGVYSNLAMITHSDSEFVVDFVSVLPGLQKGEIRSRVIMTPQNAKRFLGALADNVRKYEEKYGIIDANTNNDRTIPILGGNGGLA
ncbi:MAG: DUF3467 domain-containing protein [Bacteroidales bacterium]|nr:DUF3467 domain-containing protein [Bacteroidales bacterium]